MKRKRARERVDRAAGGDAPAAGSPPFPALLTPREVAALLRMEDRYDGDFRPLRAALERLEVPVIWLNGKHWRVRRDALLRALDRAEGGAA